MANVSCWTTYIAKNLLSLANYFHHNSYINFNSNAVMCLHELQLLTMLSEHVSECVLMCFCVILGKSVPGPSAPKNTRTKNGDERSLHVYCYRKYF